MLRIAMLSFAHVHSDGYARQVADHPEAEIACVWDDDEARGRGAAERYGVPYLTDLEAVLDSKDVDAVVVDAPTAQHKALILAAIARGKHVFTEKALTVTTGDSDEVVKAVHQSGIRFMISLPSRMRAEILMLKKAVDSGWLGRVTMVRARIAHSAALDRWFEDGSAWFADVAQAGGGAMFDLGCHTMDVLRWFFGEPGSVMAKLQNYSESYDIDDQSVVVVEFKNNTLAVLDTSWVHRAGPGSPIEIYGTEGFAQYNGSGKPVQLISTHLQPEGISGTIYPDQLPETPPMPMQQWVGAILHGTPMTITVEDGRNLTQLLEGIYEAGRTGKEVRF